MKRKLQMLLIFVPLIGAIAVGGCGAAAVKTNALGEKYPSHQIKVIVPFGAGGGLDAQARVLQKVATKYLHQPFIVFNKAGGGGNIGLSELAKSTPDGYTVGISSPEVIFHSVYGTAKHHYLTALDPIAQISSTAHFIVVNAESPWNSVEDLIQYGKTTPLKFGHGGIGSISHVIGETFGKVNHLKTLQVPFKGGNERTGMLLGSHVDAIIIPYAPAKEFIESGKLRILASTAPKRLEDPLFADVPTLKELGMDIEFTVWYGIATPKPLPPEIKAKLVEGVKKMILDPEVNIAMKKLGVQVDYLGPEESQEKWMQEAEKLQKAITETGVLEQIKMQQGITPQS